MKISVLVVVFLLQVIPISFAKDQTAVILPDGTVIEGREIYSSPNPTDDLIDAVAVKDLEMVKKLVAEGVDINQPTSSGNLALFEALNEKNSQILDYLLEQGADVNKPVVMGEMQLTPLHVAVNQGYKQTLRKLLERGANVEQEDGILNETVLFTAIRKNEPELVQILTDHGADVQHQSLLGETPLSLAESHNNVEILGILQKESV
jgi:uncharacterized protein